MPPKRGAAGIDSYSPDAFIACIISICCTRLHISLCLASFCRATSLARCSFIHCSIVNGFSVFVAYSKTGECWLCGRDDVGVTDNHVTGYNFAASITYRPLTICVHL